MSNCGDCGAELAVGSSVCGKCGKQVHARGAKKVARRAPAIMTRTVPLIVYISGGLALIGILTLSVPLMQPMDQDWGAIYFVVGLGMIAVGAGLFIVDRMRRRRH
jgi:hypothetical protein